MAKSAVQKHIHKVKRLRFKSGNSSYFCTLPDCYFKINPSLYLGKKTICWRCGEDFIMNEYSLRLARPHCEKCHKTKAEHLPESTLEQLNKEWIHPPTTEEQEAAMSLADKLTSLIKKQSNNAVATDGEEDI